MPETIILGEARRATQRAFIILTFRNPALGNTYSYETLITITCSSTGAIGLESNSLINIIAKLQKLVMLLQ